MHERMTRATLKADLAFEELKREMVAHAQVAERMARALLKVAGHADYGKLTPNDLADIQEARHYALGSGAPVDVPVRVTYPGKVIEFPK